MATSSWKIDTSHSGIHFWVRHMVIAKVHGRFAKFSGSLQLDEEELARSSVSVEIDAASIDTNEASRDAHLRSADFLDVEKFPRLTFRSKAIDRRGERYAVIGELSLHGVTREVALETEFLGRGKDAFGVERAVFSAKTALERKDFGLTWNKAIETGGVLVGDKVEVQLEIEAVRA